MNKVSKEVAKRSKQAAKELNKRSQQAQRELVKRSEKPNQKQFDQVGTFWTVFGFSTGLTAALIAGYLLIRKRIQRNEKKNLQVQISQNGYLNGSSKSIRAGEILSADPSTSATNTSTAPTAEEPTPSIAVAEPTTEPVEDRTNDSTFLGVVSTKLYYPVETPLSQLAPPENGSLDVVYFVSEDEARAQGFSAAE